ncbi:hypothetical protein CBS101457_005876 [Exobasidium rhododendri]|nr:hypothetical protein CBS101457_005876 [Exobasidium rhododendri]
MTGRVLARHRQESLRNNGASTPSDERTSWLSDDVCANCGAQTQASYLFCSQQCKEMDAKSLNGVASGIATASAPSFPTDPTTNVALSCPPCSNAKQQQIKFRYKCPPSPNILAKYNNTTTTTNNNHSKPSLTSPALIALGKSLPTVNSTSESIQSMSSSEESDGAVLHKSIRRSSSRSTFSSASDRHSTDLNTFSPVSTANNRESDDDLSDLDSSDLILPPSVQSILLLNSSVREARPVVSESISVTPGCSKPDAISKWTATTTGHSPVHNSAMSKNARNTIDFARRPGTTNLPPPVLFTSPVLATSMVRTKDQRRRSNRKMQEALQDAQVILTNRMSEVLPSKTARPSVKSAPYSSPATSLGGALPVKKSNRGRDYVERANLNSASPPPQASASSSAGMTLRANSPVESNTTSPELLDVVCGRFGCAGAASSEASVHQASDSQDFSVSSRRSSFASRHRHTHSAAASLSSGDFDDSKKSPSIAAKSKAKLTMTPFGGAVDSIVEKDFSSKKPALLSSEDLKLEERVMTPPRGRSKARGRRSTSRRSPSPPRGVARRGHSEELNGKDVTSRLTSQSPQESPIASARSKPLSTSSQNEQRHGEDDRERGRRGRSPTERGVVREAPLITTIHREDCVKQNAYEACEMAWPAYGHLSEEDPKESKDVDMARSVATAVVTGPAGYDDVDLDEM